MMRLEGRIEDFDLLEVLQAALRHATPSQLLVADEEREGHLRTEGGYIVDARWESYVGGEAIFKLLSCENGLFALSPFDETEAALTSLHWTWHHLLSEAMRRSALSEPSEIAPMAEGEIISLSQDVSILLNSLEADVARLADEEAGPVALLTGQCELVNLAVSLAPEQARKLEFRLQDVLPRHGWKGFGASFVQIDGNLANGQGIPDFYSAAAFDPASRSQEARAAAQILTASLDEILHRICGLLGTTDTEDLKRRVVALVAEVSSLVKNCKF